MAGKVFVDSNILLYAVDRSDAARRTAARRTLRSLIKERRGVVSTQVAQEFYVIATRKLGVIPAAARRVLEHIEVFEMVNVDINLIYEAIDCSVLSQISFWDALIVVSAKASGCKEVFSEDLGHMQVIRGIRVINPFQQRH